MAAPITFSLDLEDHRPDESAELRFPQITRRVLDFLEERNIVGTFFVVGEVAEAEPDLVREVAARGHELGLHAYRHVPLTELDPDRFREEAARGKAAIEDLTGDEVVGFRAPTYSLVPDSIWAVDVLGELGFTYSSSILPAANPLFGFPGAPEVPFRWPNGLVELPAPLTGVGSARLPFLGGTYLRVLPWPVVVTARRLGDLGPVPWTYCHPYDFDPGERFWWVPDAGRMAPLLWVGRRRMETKIRRLLATGAGAPLRDRLDEADRGGVFDPATGEITPVPVDGVPGGPAASARMAS
ncbi:MAG: polysaccharide deacetylase family protein [Acidimicrobiales bacterium]